MFAAFCIPRGGRKEQLELHLWNSQLLGQEFIPGRAHSSIYTQRLWGGLQAELTLKIGVFFLRLTARIVKFLNPAVLCEVVLHTCCEARALQQQGLVAKFGKQLL